MIIRWLDDDDVAAAAAASAPSLVPGYVETSTV
jgi:hypothetical protein